MSMITDGDCNDGGADDENGVRVCALSSELRRYSFERGLKSFVNYQITFLHKILRLLGKWIFIVIPRPVSN